ncbi:MAG: UDP-N-acetylglucosamine 2-epimerase (non-hydrolyzing) [Bacteroidales bacterium]|nr:UDP-N-acetylglucosamine 2-epimerase (non-hydrolyzing) [Bacteroidales bacterium]
MKIISVVGARPNFMKIAPFIRAIQHSTFNIQHLLVHTGQHYDDRMSLKFFKDLGIPEADINLGVGSGTHAEQVGQTMIEFEKVLQKERPDWVVVVGDVNATLACSVTAKKEHIKCCHIEAGLRSGDMTMPEEINRLVTDRLCDLLLTPDKLSIENLKKEGVENFKIKFVGNIMIDTLEANRAKAEKLNVEDIIKTNAIHNIHDIQHLNKYALMTLHRPSNVDHEEVLKSLVTFIHEHVSQDIKLIWTIHPRAKKQLELYKLWDSLLKNKNIILLHPLGYHDMLRLNMDATIMLTDSGGLQEECTILGTPCLTLRWNTERPITLKEHGGASVLVGNNIDRIRKEFINTLKENRLPAGQAGKSHRPELWDGHTAERCLQAILNYHPE